MGLSVSLVTTRAEFLAFKSFWGSEVSEKTNNKWEAHPIRLRQLFAPCEAPADAVGPRNSCGHHPRHRRQLSAAEPSADPNPADSRNQHPRGGEQSRGGGGAGESRDWPGLRLAQTAGRSKAPRRKPQRGAMPGVLGPVAGRNHRNRNRLNPRPIRGWSHWVGRPWHPPRRISLIGRDPVEPAQLALFCGCGQRSVELRRRGCCRVCYGRHYRSLRFFGGLRDVILKRDRFRCRACSASARLVVHHRSGVNRRRLLITLCIGCHTRVHCFRALRSWVPEVLLKLWRERHPREPIQLQLPFGIRDQVIGLATIQRKPADPRGGEFGPS